MRQSEEFVVAELKRQTDGRSTPILVAIDGRSGVGKSTLAIRFADALDGTVVEGDDFYLGGTDEQWAESTVVEKVKQCIDWRRLRDEALMPLLSAGTATYHPFNFATRGGLANHIVTLPPSNIIILDGIYSARPELQDLIDLAVLVETADDLVRRHRLVAREGQAFMAAWHATWDEAEDYYFSVIRPRASFDLIVNMR